MQKVFGIGLSRTGTQSLSTALRMLGYRTIHYPEILVYKKGRLSMNHQVLESYDAALDTPVARFYKEIDSLFPGSKFILTIRDKKSWLPSCEKIFGAKIKFRSEYINQIFIKAYLTLKKAYKLYKGMSLPLSIKKPDQKYLSSYQLTVDLYSVNSFERHAFTRAYSQYVKDVLYYFKDRKEDLLVIDITAGEGWESLCPFLGTSIPDKSFPHKDNVKKSTGDTIIV